MARVCATSAIVRQVMCSILSAGRSPEIIIATKMISAKLFVRIYGRPWLREPSTSCSRREAMALCCGAFSAGQWCRNNLHPRTKTM